MPPPWKTVIALPTPPRWGGEELDEPLTREHVNLPAINYELVSNELGCSYLGWLVSFGKN